MRQTTTPEAQKVTTLEGYLGREAVVYKLVETLHRVRFQSGDTDIMIPTD